jgi:hypothetical protein
VVQGKLKKPGVSFLTKPGSLRYDDKLFRIHNRISVFEKPKGVKSDFPGLTVPGDLENRLKNLYDHKFYTKLLYTSKNPEQIDVGYRMYFQYFHPSVAFPVFPSDTQPPNWMSELKF